jgi:hypothetical protein
MNTSLDFTDQKLNPEQRRRHIVLLELLVRALREVTELNNGFQLRFTSGSSIWMIVAEFVNLERQRAPSLHFTLERDGEAGAVWLRVIGAEAAKRCFLEQWKSNPG